MIHTTAVTNHNVSHLLIGLVSRSREWVYFLLRAVMVGSLTVTCFIFFAVPARADACSAILCLAGMLQGNSPGAACAAPIAEYFGIIVFDKYGFNPYGTFASRLNFLQGCPATGISTWINSIQATYGYLEAL